MHHGACQDRRAGKDFLLHFDPCGEGRLHIRHEDDLVHHVSHCGAILRENLLDVGVGLAHLDFHVSHAEDISLVVMAHLAGKIDAVPNLDCLGVAVLTFPRQSRLFASLLIVMMFPSALEVDLPIPAKI